MFRPFSEPTQGNELSEWEPSNFLSGGRERNGRIDESFWLVHRKVFFVLFWVLLLLWLYRSSKGHGPDRWQRRTDGKMWCVWGGGEWGMVY